MTGFDELFSLGEALIDRLFPDKIKRAEEMRKLEELKQNGDLARLQAYVTLMEGQLKINLKEAESKSMFVAGWRPAVGWVCVSILAFNYIGVWLLEYVTNVAGFLSVGSGADSIVTIPVPPRMDMAELWPVLLGMLGMGSMRSFDKMKGTDTKKAG
jgi:hypothetical protein